MKSPGAYGSPGTLRSRYKKRDHVASPTPSTAILNQPQQPFQGLLPNLAIPRQDATSAVVNMSGGSGHADEDNGADGPAAAQAIVLVGGRNAEQQSLNVVELLEWNLPRHWWRLPNLQTPRCGCAVATMGRNIYVMGGLNAQSQPLATMEHYQIGGPSWNQVATLATPRWYAAATALPELNQVLIVGGRDHTWQELDTCELYSIDTNTFEANVPAMNTKRFGCGICLLEALGGVLVVGGYNGSEWTKTCELYNVATDQWETKEEDGKDIIPPMPVTVEFCVASVWKDYVFVRGTSSSNGSSDDNTKRQAVTQVYWINEKKWTVLPINNPNSMSDDRYLNPMNASMVALAQRCVIMGGTLPKSTVMDAGLNSGSNHQHSHHSSSHNDNEDDSDSDEDGQDADDDVDATATTLCTFLKVDMQQLFPQAQQIPNAPPFLFENDEDSAHPLSYVPSSNQSISSKSSRRSRATDRGSKDSIANNSARQRRRKVQNEQLLDNYGVQVTYTGYVLADSGRPHGKGKMTWTMTQDIYEGVFEHGARQGRGKMSYKNGDIFEGSFMDDQRQGRGLYAYRDGRKYDGMYVDDVAEDPNGTMTWRDGTLYIGQFKRSKRTGKGTITFPNSNVKYQGDFINGKYNGFGSCRFADGSVYEGQWKGGKAHGIGRLTNSQGEVIHDGKWVNDGPVV